jgi:hypothetical protein
MSGDLLKDGVNRPFSIHRQQPALSVIMFQDWTSVLLKHIHPLFDNFFFVIVTMYENRTITIVTRSSFLGPLREEVVDCPTVLAGTTVGETLD